MKDGKKEVICITNEIINLAPWQCAVVSGE